MSGDHWDKISAPAKDLIKLMLSKENQRISAQEAFHHPYFDFILSKNLDPTIIKQSAEHVSKALYQLRTFSSKNKARQAALGYLVQHFMTANDVNEL